MVISTSSSNQGSCPYYTVIDNSATQNLVGNVHWVTSKKYDSWIGVDSSMGPSSTTTLRLVNAYSTLVDDSGKHVAVLWLNQAWYCAGLEQSLIAKGQWNYGVEVHSWAKLFNGKQSIIAKNSKTAKPFKINLGWDGSLKFILTADLTKKDLKTLPHIHKTSKGSYDPQKESKKHKANSMVSSRNCAFQRARPHGRKFKWTPEQLVEWKR